MLIYQKKMPADHQIARNALFRRLWAFYGSRIHIFQSNYRELIKGLRIRFNDQGLSYDGVLKDLEELRNAVRIFFLLLLFLLLLLLLFTFLQAQDDLRLGLHRVLDRERRRPALHTRERKEGGLLGEPTARAFLFGRVSIASSVRCWRSE